MFIKYLTAYENLPFFGKSIFFPKAHSPTVQENRELL